VD
ncbi:RHS repeat-associated core domain protein, partial [Vibrio parahaemolyticus V-223/04]|jgi:hypothetical protein